MKKKEFRAHKWKWLKIIVR